VPGSETYNHYRNKHGKRYEPAEEADRELYFHKNLRFIHMANRKYRQEGRSLVRIPRYYRSRRVTCPALPLIRPCLPASRVRSLTQRSHSCAGLRPLCLRVLGVCIVQVLAPNMLVDSTPVEMVSAALVELLVSSHHCCSSLSSHDHCLFVDVSRDAVRCPCRFSVCVPE
jgi:hypothetical protein